MHFKTFYRNVKGYSTKIWCLKFQSIPATMTGVVDLVGIMEDLDQKEIREQITKKNTSKKSQMR